jgi:hypothetical protein
MAHRATGVKCCATGPQLSLHGRVRPTVDPGDLAAQGLAMYTMLASALTATAHGSLPAGTVAATVFVRPSITARVVHDVDAVRDIIERRRYRHAASPTILTPFVRVSTIVSALLFSVANRAARSFR